MFNELQGAKDNFIKLNPAQNMFLYVQNVEARLENWKCFSVSPFQL